jgi:AcrR family transcriptional regulator
LARRAASATAARHPRPRGGRLEEVRDAALTLFAREGYAATNMTDIARELQLGAPSLYNHIASKGEVLRDLCAQAMAQLLERQQAALHQPDPVSRLRVMTEGHVAFSATHPREIVVTAREFIHLDGPARQEILELRQTYERGFRNVIVEGRDAGLFDVDHPKLASYAIIEMGLSVAEWYRDGGALSVEAVAHEYGRFGLRVVRYRDEFD